MKRMLGFAAVALIATLATSAEASGLKAHVRARLRIR